MTIEKLNEINELKKLTCLKYDEHYKALWLDIKPEAMCVSVDLLKESVDVIDFIRNSTLPIDYLIVHSSLRGVFNLGGDLAYFVKCIEARDRSALMEYATNCVNYVNELVHNFGRDCISIALVEGAALGGGFEYALAADFILAKEKARLGFPEIAFDLFPGMGAISFLNRRVSPSTVFDLVVGGKVDTAKYFKEIGLVHSCFESGKGVDAVHQFITNNKMRLNGLKAITKAKRIQENVSKEELQNITSVWVDYAFNVSEENLNYMRQLVAMQQVKAAVK